MSSSVLILFAATLIGLTLSTSTKMDADLQSKLHARSDSTLTVILTFKHDNADLYTRMSNVQTRTFADRTERILSVTGVMQATAEYSQSEVLKFLERAQKNGHDQMNVESIWLTNQAIIRNAKPQLIQDLAKFSSIESMESEKFYPLPKLEQSGPEFNLTATTETRQSKEAQWGVEKVDAPRVWDMFGIYGQGIRVGIVDTGVLLEHEALRNNFLGRYGWYDPAKKTASPYDDAGHGTHCAGTILGTKYGIGVAPQAKWMACKGCGTTQCSSADLLTCGQFMTCPTDTDGSNPNCKMAPQVISNSWGGFTPVFSDNSNDKVIKAQRAAGIIPIYAIGNSMACASTSTPGSHDNVIGVGSTTIKDVVADHSSRGPTRGDFRIKPDIAAPGQDIYSSYNGGPQDYKKLSGTSMATPHVAGVVALILSSQPNRNLTYNQVYEALTKTADKTNPTNSVFGAVCGSQSTYPNNFVGSGRVNAKNAVLYLRQK